MTEERHEHFTAFLRAAGALIRARQREIEEIRARLPLTDPPPETSAAPDEPTSRAAIETKSSPSSGIEIAPHHYSPENRT